MTPKSTDNRYNIALFPGSFDPFTKGHLSILERFLPLFDRIIIAVGVNLSKNTDKCEIDKRVESIKNTVSAYPSVDVISYTGLTVEAAKGCGAQTIIKGVRDMSDYEYERRMADINRSISGIETVFMFSLPEYSSLSSSVVRELIHYGQDVTEFLPFRK